MQFQNLILSENYFLKNINISLYSFNGKEKDDEWNGTTGGALDFGSRIYDSRVGRWLTCDREYKKYPNLSPYSAFGNNPIIITDPGGDTLRIAIGDGQGVNDIYSLVASRSYLTISCGQNIVTLNMANIPADAINPDGSFKDAGLQLLYNLSTAPQNYLYQTDTKALYKDKYGTPHQDNLSDDNKNANYAIDNKSGTSLWPSFPGDNKKSSGLQPLDKLGREFDGVVTIHPTAEFHYADGSVKPRPTVVFHELWENFERTTNNKFYGIPEFRTSGYNKGSMVYSDGPHPKWADITSNLSAHGSSVTAQIGFHLYFDKTPGAAEGGVTHKIDPKQENKPNK
jgi:RHS repeat-associated protein